MLAVSTITCEVCRVPSRSWNRACSRVAAESIRQVTAQVHTRYTRAAEIQPTAGA